MLYTLPSIFVQRPRARPSSPRQAPLCGWAPDEALSRHRHQSPPTSAGAPVPGVQGAEGVPICPFQSPSRDPSRKLGNRCAGRRENKVCSNPSQSLGRTEERRWDWIYRHQKHKRIALMVTRVLKLKRWTAAFLLRSQVDSHLRTVPLPFTLRGEGQRAWKAKARLGDAG